MTAIPGWDGTPSELAGGLKGSEVLFLGLGKSAVCWYRCALPAMFLGADWVGVQGEPPHFKFQTGLVRRSTQIPDMDDYRVVVVQQPRGRHWLRGIKNLQARGIKVLYEIDDYVHAIRKMPDHDFASSFTKGDVDEMELCMRACDGLIASTDFIARRYRAFNPNVWVCQNGVDVGRYALTLPERPKVVIGWAGATGHGRAMEAWLPTVAEVMRRHEDTCFVTIGMPFADRFMPEFGTRALSVPFTMIDTYPAAMTLMDIALAPAGKGNFFRAKSDLRWVEAGALGIPAIADPAVYPEIEDGTNGFHADTPGELELRLERLIGDPSLRLQAGAKAKEHVHACRHAGVTCRQWERVFAAVLE